VKRFLLVLLAIGIPIGGAGCGKSTAANPVVSVRCPSSPMHQKARQATWNSEPQMKISKSGNFKACIETSVGNMVVDLMPKAAPQSVNAFIILANHKFYNGATFDRIVPHSLVEGGQRSGPNFSLPIENPGTNFMPLTVGLEHASDGQSNVGRFFICSGQKCATLDGTGVGKRGYSVIGFVDKGARVVHAIAHDLTGSSPRAVLIRTVRIKIGQSPPYYPGDNSGS
jgi:cyclophilin family peptidyl-prolyl cis-trans isomerase